MQLSDSSIAIRGKGARLHVDLKDEEYAFHIWELFNAIGIVGAQPYLNSQADGRQTYALATFTHPYFTDLQSKWYTIVDGKPVKVLPENIADLLTPIAIAYWLCWDGLYDKTQGAVTIHTESFKPEEIDTLRTRSIGSLWNRIYSQCYQ